MLEKIINHRRKIDPPEHLKVAALYMWKLQGKDKEFLETNCEMTTYAIKDMFYPGEAYNKWEYSQILPSDADMFEVVFGELGGEEHFMFVVGNKVYQSYAFEHGVQESNYDKTKYFWEHISRNKKKYEGMEIYFMIKKE